MSAYHLTFQFKSNERPWSGSHTGYNIETDEDARRWAQYFVDKIGDDYIISLFKNGVVIPLSEADADRADRCDSCNGEGCTICQGEDMEVLDGMFEDREREH